MSRKAASRSTAGALTGCVLALSVAACTSTSTSSTASSASATTAATSTLLASNSPSPVTGKPGCDDAIQAFRDASANMASKVQSLPTLQAYVTALVARLHTAAGVSTDPAVQSAVNKLADDFNGLVTAAQTSNGSQIETVMSSLAADGQAVVKVCS